MGERIDYARRARELSSLVPPEGWAADSLHRVHGYGADAVARRLRISRPRCVELLAAAAAAYEASTDYLSARAGECDDNRRRHEGTGAKPAARSTHDASGRRRSQPRVRGAS